MPLTYGGKVPKSIKYNNAEVKSIIYGGKTVWTSEKPWTTKDVHLTFDSTFKQYKAKLNLPDGTNEIKVVVKQTGDQSQVYNMKKRYDQGHIRRIVSTGLWLYFITADENSRVSLYGENRNLLLGSIYSSSQKDYYDYTVYYR